MGEPICENCGMAHAPGDTSACIEGHGGDPIQVTIHGRYGRGPMPVEFRDALVEMVKLVVEAVDRGEIGKKRATD